MKTFILLLACLLPFSGRADEQSLKLKADAQTLSDLQNLQAAQTLTALVTLRSYTPDEMSQIAALPTQKERFEKLTAFCQQRMVPILALGSSVWLRSANATEIPPLIVFKNGLLMGCQMIIALNLRGAELLSESSEILSVMSNRTIESTSDRNDIKGGGP